jgi:hypothetical protein
MIVFLASAATAETVTHGISVEMNGSPMIAFLGLSVLQVVAGGVSNNLGEHWRAELHAKCDEPPTSGSAAVGLRRRSGL